MNKFSVNIFILSLVALFFNSCSKEDIAGKFEGAWKTEWEDYLKGDTDEITIEEVIVFQNGEYSNSSGVFSQFFSGIVKYDDWINETDIPYLVRISGTWTQKGKDEIILRYDMNSFDTQFEKSKISTGDDEILYDFLKGDMGSMFFHGLKSLDEDKKLNTKVNNEVSKQVSAFFKDMFNDMNKDKEAMKDIKIDAGMMTCEINHGFFGRDATYYKITPEELSQGNKKSENNKKSNKKSKKKSSSKKKK